MEAYEHDLTPFFGNTKVILHFFPFFGHTLTCQIIMQQILLFLGEKNTYTTLLGTTSLLISEIFPSNPDFQLHK